jgi:hypothetical protein
MAPERDAVSVAVMAAHTAAHSAVLTVLDSLCPLGVPVDAALVAWLLDMPEADVMRLCD